MDLPMSNSLQALVTTVLSAERRLRISLDTINVVILEYYISWDFTRL